MILGIVIAFNILGNTSDTLIDGSNEITYADRCAETRDSVGTAYFFNLSDKYCWNSTDKVALATYYTLPLFGLFTSSGVVLLVVMAAILIALIFFALRYVKRK